MNDRQILMLMAKTPKIRAVQIADALDQELAAVSAALRPLVEIGHVIQSKGTAPNGHQAQVYDLSEAFKTTNEYRSIMVELAGRAAHESTQASAVVPATTTPEPSTAAAPADSLKASKVDLAVAYIAVNKCVPDADLRRVMELTTGQYPIAYLATAIKAGRVAKTQAGWVTGPGRAETGTEPRAKRAYTKRPKDKAPPPTARQNILPPDLSRQLGTLPAPAAQAVQAQLGQIASSASTSLNKPTASDLPTTPKFRCGFWSDGVLELQRDGAQIAALTQGEGEQFAAFMSRVKSTFTNAEVRCD